MAQAPGFEVTGKENWVCLLKGSLYGLPESGQCAQKNLVRIMTQKANYRQLDSEQMVFFRKSAAKHLVGGFHVDDYLDVGNDRAMFDELLKFLLKTV